MRARLADARLRPIRNLAPNPRAVAPLAQHWAGYAGVSGVGTLTSATETAGTFARFTWSTASTTAGGGIYLGTTAVGRIPATAGRQYFVSMRVRSSVDQTIRLGADFRDGNDVRVGSPVQVAVVPVKANIWRYVSGWFTVPAGSNRVAVTAYAADGDGGVVWPAGATLDGTDALVAETAGRPGFSDGGSPNWRWTGTPNASTSIGYPNLATLESIAGPPGGMIYGLGQIWNTIPGGPLEPVTMYFAYHASGSTAANYPSFAQFGAATAGAGRITIQCGAPGSDDIRARFDTANGATNIVVPALGGRAAPGTHVLVARMPAGLAKGYVSLNGGEESNKSLAAGDGIPRTWLNVAGSGTNELIPLWTVVYSADHPASTRAQIVSWLRSRP